MFFKKKVTIEDYCRTKLTRLFSQDREATRDDPRNRCNDAAHLNEVDRKAYYDNLRAAMIELMTVAVSKTFHWKLRLEAGTYVDAYLKEQANRRLLPCICNTTVFLELHPQTECC